APRQHQALAKPARATSSAPAKAGLANGAAAGGQSALPKTNAKAAPSCSALPLHCGSARAVRTPSHTRAAPSTANTADVADAASASGTASVADPAASSA